MRFEDKIANANANANEDKSQAVQLCPILIALQRPDSPIMVR